MTHTHGGRRPGAGRPRKDPAGPVEQYNVNVTPTERQHLEEIGGGTVQQGVRVLIDRSMKRRRTTTTATTTATPAE